MTELPRAHTRRAHATPGAPRPRSVPWGRLTVLVLGLHAALAFWGATRNSVTFDENFHVPAGVAAFTRGDLGASDVNPPLVKLGFGAAALLAGAHGVEAPATPGDARAEGESFMRRNADRYARVFLAARLVSVLLSLALGALLWRFVAPVWGGAAACFGVCLMALSPEMLAHAGLATLDVATAVGWFATTIGAIAWARRGGVRRFSALAVAAVFLGLTRFSVLLALPMVAGVVLVVSAIECRAQIGRRLAPLLLLIPLLLAAWQVAYLGRTSLRPIGQQTFVSARFQNLARDVPGLRLPLPDAMLRGLDHQAYDAEPGKLTTFVNRRITTGIVWWWFPYAIAVKWPLGLLLAIVLGVVLGLVRGDRATRVTMGALVLSAAMFLLPAMFFANLNAGVRYALPLLPLGAVCAASLLAPGGLPASRGTWRLALPLTLAAAVAAESAFAAPWWLSSFNPLAGPPDRREFVLNDSNVDWGQGLIALRDEMRRRGIEHIHLAYHGSTDPAIYGIRSTPYLGGVPGPESEWLAVSSYYFVGLPQRMMTATGYTPQIVVLDMRPLWTQWPAARPANCMRLYRVR